MKPARERIKVVHVVTRLDLGGAQQNTLYTVSHLDPEAFDVLLVAGPGGELEAEGARAPRLRRVASLVREVRPCSDLLAFLELTSLFLAERPDVVHTHSSKAGILGRLAARLAGVPVVVHTYHGFGFHDRQPGWLKGLYVLLERLCCALSDCTIFVSKANWEYALRHRLGDPQRYRLIRSGVKLSELPAQVADVGRRKAQAGLRMHKPLVLSIGNLKPQKNPADFVTMAALVAQTHPETEFVFVGDGPLRGSLEARVVAAGLHGRVHLPGWRRDAAELLACADVFVLTSLWEGLPRALVEAMKSGVPSVCYATDGVSDLLRDGENGFAVPQGDVAALAARVSALLSDQALRRRLGAAAAASIGEEFDIDQMVRDQEKLYRRLLKAVKAVSGLS